MRFLSFSFFTHRLRVGDRRGGQKVGEVVRQTLDRRVAGAGWRWQRGRDVLVSGGRGRGAPHIHHALVGVSAEVLRRRRHRSHGDGACGVVPHGRAAHHVRVAVPVGQVLGLEVRRRRGCGCRGGRRRGLHDGGGLVVVQQVVRVVLRVRVRVGVGDCCGGCGCGVVVRQGGGRRRRGRGQRGRADHRRLHRVVVLLVEAGRAHPGRHRARRRQRVVARARVRDRLVVAVVRQDRVLAVDLINRIANVVIEDTQKEAFKILLPSYASLDWRDGYMTCRIP